MQRKKTKRSRKLAAYIADAGVASRRKSEVLVTGGLVRVNGRVVDDPAVRIIPGQDRVSVGGELITTPSKKTYYILNKPKGYLSSCGDPGGKPTVLDLLPLAGRRLYPVGRLDFNAEGLILLTDDGDTAYRLTHPRFQVPRTYLVKVKGKPEAQALRKLTRGVRDGGELLSAREIRCIKRTRTNSWFEVVLTEGRNREIRRLFSSIEHLVIRIIRISFGPLELGQLKPGESRRLTGPELKKLKDYVESHGPEN